MSATAATLTKLLAWRPGGYLRASGVLFGWLVLRALPGCRFLWLLPRGLEELDGSTWSLPNLFVYQNLLAVRPGAPLPFPFRH